MSLIICLPFSVVFPLLLHVGPFHWEAIRYDLGVEDYGLVVLEGNNVSLLDDGV